MRISDSELSRLLTIEPDAECSQTDACLCDECMTWKYGNS